MPDHTAPPAASPSSRPTFRRRGLAALAFIAVLGGLLAGAEWLVRPWWLAPPMPDIPYDQRHLGPVSPRITAAMAERGMSAADPIMIRIYKQDNVLEVWKQPAGTGRYVLLQSWPVCAWSGTLGRKQREGDHQAPEGFYSLTVNSLYPGSDNYLAFNLGFPNRLDRALGYTGSALMVHGRCSSVGCYAMTDGGIAEIYPLVREALAAGQKSIQVQALPFRMTEANLAAQAHSRHLPFWLNLKQGAQAFDRSGVPPRVAACGQRYVFNVTGAGPLDPARPCPSLTPDPIVSAAGVSGML